MHKFSRPVLAFCLAIIAIFASGCVAVTAVPSPTQTSIPSQTLSDIPTPFFTKTPSPTLTILPDTLTPTSVPEFGWSILFQYDFEENYWAPGKHSYRIIANCPDTEYFGDLDTSVAFIVDNDAYLLPSGAVIEFSYNYIGVKWDGYNVFLGSFHPQQKSRIFLAMED
ncbi:MAG: hypothetical protein HY869_21955 [Chloroflexi bacterium]|nr:hypothetical protein [Chloroflexota bacterium]